jgi:hypothetical protein
MGMELIAQVLEKWEPGWHWQMMLPENRLHGGHRSLAGHPQ